METFKITVKTLKLKDEVKTAIRTNQDLKYEICFTEKISTDTLRRWLIYNNNKLTKPSILNTISKYLNINIAEIIETNEE